MKKWLVACILCLPVVSAFPQVDHSALFRYDQNGLERMMDSVTPENSTTGSMSILGMITGSNSTVTKSGYYVVSACVGCTGPLLGAGIMAFYEYEKHNSWPSSQEFLIAGLIGSLAALAISGNLALIEPREQKSAGGFIAASLVGSTLVMIGLLLVN